MRILKPKRLIQPQPTPTMDSCQRANSCFYHLSHSSSFFADPPMLPLPPLFFIALVPIPLGFFFSIVVLVLASPALANSSQKSCLSFAGPLGAAPKLSQKSLRSGSGAPRRAVDEESSPSTKRVNCVLAVATPDWRVWPRVPAVLRA